MRQLPWHRGLIAVVDPKIAVTELELMQIDVHAATVPPLPKSLHLVLHDTWGMSGYSRCTQRLAFVSRLPRTTPLLGLLPQGSRGLRPSSRLAPHPMALPAPAPAHWLLAAPTPAALSPIPASPASGDLDRSRDSPHATLDQHPHAEPAGTRPCHTLAVDRLRARQAETNAGTSSRDASSSRRRPPSPNTTPLSGGSFLPSSPGSILTSGAAEADDGRGSTAA